MKKALKRSLSMLLAITIIFSSAYVGLSEIDFSGSLAVEAEALPWHETEKAVIGARYDVSGMDIYGGKITFVLDANGKATFTSTGSEPLKMMYYDHMYNESMLCCDTRVRDIIIGNKIKNIGAMMFYGCSELEKVEIGTDVTTIDEKAFYGCKNLKEIAIPKSVTYIQGDAFAGCDTKYDTDPDTIDGMIIYCEEGSYAEAFARSNMIEYKRIKYLSNGSWKPLDEKPIPHENTTFTINVEALDENKKCIAAEDADVNICLGDDIVYTKKTDESGKVTFTRKELLKKGIALNLNNNYTVSACLKIEQIDDARLKNDIFELHSEEVNENGVWVGVPFEDGLTLTVDEPRWSPTLKVLIDEDNVMSCIGVLKKYSKYFAQATNGHVIVNEFKLITVPDDKKKSKDELVEITTKKNCNICMVRNSNTQAIADVEVKSYSKGGKDNVTGGYHKKNKIIWCPINNVHCENTLCHESGHYLFGFADEYASAIGFYGETIEQLIDTGYYSYDADGNGSIDKSEINNAYWNMIAGNKQESYYTERPAGAPLSFGLMELEWYGENALEMSRAADYNGVVSKITDYDSLTQEDVMNYTQQYFLSNASCEEKMKHEFEKMANDSGYSIDFTGAFDDKQTAEYSYAGGKNVKFILNGVPIDVPFFDDFVMPDINDYVSLKMSSAAAQTEVLQDYEFNYNGSVLDIKSQSAAEVSVVDFDGTIVFSATLNEDNNYKTNFEIPAGENYYINATQVVNGEAVTRQYYLETVSINSDVIFDNTSPTVSLYSENETQAAIIQSGETVTNGEYSSVIGEYNVLSSDASETGGRLQTSLSHELNIDYTSLTWFYMEDSEWIALDTVHSIGEHGNPNFSCSFAGNGKYCLMAKAATEGTLNTPSEVTVTAGSPTTDGEVIVSFVDDNEDVLNYNVYYSTEPITAENYENAEKKVVFAGANKAYITVDNVGSEYYFAVQAIGKTGAKSEISENVTFTSSYRDSDNDGIPDSWFYTYYQLKDVENVAEVDSDGDELTNLEEYENGTNPLNPDTDGDNVYDGIECEFKLNPLASMTDGETDDYLIVYGENDLSINNITFDDEYVYFDVSNATDGSAMQTIIEVVSGEKTIALWTADMFSKSITFSFDKSLVADLDSFTIKVDEAQLTRDTDYTNNIYEYIPATEIAIDDLTLVKGSKHTLAISTQPENSTEIYKYTVTPDDDTIKFDTKTGTITAEKLGKVKLQVETLNGVTDECDITVIPFEGADYTEFDCELINNDTEVAITGYEGVDTAVIIPEAIGGYPVTQLNADCLPYGITDVTIPSTVERINAKALSCDTLTNIIVDENNTVFASVDGVLYNAEKTSVLRVPEAYTETAINIPDGVISIGEYAFENCTSLTAVTIPEGVTVIYDYAFHNCSGITEISLPGSLLYINSNAFLNCTSLKILNGEAGATFNKGRIEAEDVNITSGNCNWTSDKASGVCVDLAYDLDFDINVTKAGLFKLTEYAAFNNRQFQLYIDDVLIGVITPPGNSSTEITGYDFATVELAEGTHNIRIKKNREYTPIFDYFMLTPVAGAVGEIVNGQSLSCYGSVGTDAFKNTALTDVYYCGTQEQWDTILIDSGNKPLTNATLHLEHKHSYSTEWTIDVAPTCTEDGSKSHHCTVCGDKSDVTVIAATGHNYEVVEVASAHPHEASYKCTYCEDEKTENSVVSDCIECIYGTDTPIKETENTEIDFDNRLIFTGVKNSKDITEILGLSENTTVKITASFIYDGIELYGTGSTVSVYDGNKHVGDFTLIVDGDLNGDATCDVIDAAAAHLYSVGLDEPSENEILAANGCSSDELDANSYQNVVNMCLAS